MSSRAFRHGISIVVGFRDDSVDYEVINWSQTGMLVRYDGTLCSGDIGFLDRVRTVGEDGFQPVNPRRFYVIRQGAGEMAIDFALST